jgi:hypothetical protein
MFIYYWLENKLPLIPTNMSTEEETIMWEGLGCQVVAMTFTFTVLETGTTKLSIVELFVLIYRVDRKKIV